MEKRTLSGWKALAGGLVVGGLTGVLWGGILGCEAHVRKEFGDGSIYVYNRVHSPDGNPVAYLYDSNDKYYLVYSNKSKKEILEVKRVTRWDEEDRANRVKNRSWKEIFSTKKVIGEEYIEYFDNPNNRPSLEEYLIERKLPVEDRKHKPNRTEKKEIIHDYFWWI